MESLPAGARTNVAAAQAGLSAVPWWVIDRRMDARLKLWLARFILGARDRIARMI
ncbi:hypothetical protein [Kitasatospora sp. NPDC094016]|uniref:hypothetical protein n=1 Tax=Kitasatospora sp. NPDC094016 TaxID=3154986 RepID=UPI00332476FE